MRGGLGELRSGSKDLKNSDDKGFLKELSLQASKIEPTKIEISISNDAKKLDSKVGTAKEDAQKKADAKAQSNGAESGTQRKLNESPRKDSKAEELKKPEAAEAQRLKGTGKKVLNGREKAIQKFMDSVESEFGIPPQRIVESMAQLSDQDLTESPEQNAEKIVDSLDLPDGQSERMMAMYMQFVTELRTFDSDGQKMILKNDPGVLMGDQTQLRHLNAKSNSENIAQGLEKLNQKFWMKSPQVPSSSVESALTQATPDQLQNLNFEDTQSLSDLTDVNEFKNEQIASEITAQPILNDKIGTGAMAHQQNIGAEDLKNILQEMQSLKDEKEQISALRTQLQQLNKQVGESGDSAASSSVKIENSKGDDAAADDSLTALSSDRSAPEIGSLKSEGNLQQGDSQFSQDSNLNEAGKNSIATKALNGNSENSGDAFKKSLSGDKDVESTSSKSSTSGSSSVFSSAASAVPVESLSNLKITHVGTTAGTLGAAGASLSAEEKANVQQVMNQAQYLVKNGGGEVKVQMTPEGMGTVQLKLDLKDGKVNVQMTAENHETKKILEDSLKDLKNSLSSHKLSVDHVKVDVVGAPSSEMGSQNNQNMNSDAQRDSTRQFWNQYRENFGNQSRDGYFEVPNMNKYARQMQKGPELPSLSEASSQSRKIEGRGNGLNMVA